MPSARRPKRRRPLTRTGFRTRTSSAPSVPMARTGRTGLMAGTATADAGVTGTARTGIARIGGGAKAHGTDIAAGRTRRLPATKPEWRNPAAIAGRAEIVDFRLTFA